MRGRTTATPGAPPTPESDARGLAGPLLILATFALCQKLANEPLLVAPRFWAEEAMFYYAGSLRHGWASLLAVHNGNYLFLTNLLAYAASLVPYAEAPTVTTYGALGVDFLAALLLAKLYRERTLGLAGAMLLAAFWVVMFAKLETALTATNVQWTAGASLLLVLALRPRGLDALGVPLLTWTLLAGLTGVPSVLLFPAFVLRGWFDASRFHLAAGAVLALCAIVQAVVILEFGVSGRRLSLDAYTLTMPLVLQGGLNNVLGVEHSRALAAWLRLDETRQTAGPIGVVLVFSLVMLLALWSAWRRRLQTVVFGLACLWIGSALVQTFGALGDPMALISEGNGSRYFLTATTVMALCFGIATASASLEKRVTGLAVLCLLVSVALNERATSQVVADAFKGPDWREQIEACPETGPCTVTVWPGGGWKVRLPPVR